MRLLLTFDVEPDHTTGDADPYRHLTAFFNDIVPLLIKMEVPSIMFITNKVATRFTEDILKSIDSLEIGVHTHPASHREYRQNYDKLYKYRFDEQYEMIKRDFDTIEEATGQKPRIFRAGKFAANEDTLQVLRKLGVRADSSLLVPYVFRFSALQKLPWRPFMEEGLLRVPVLAVDMRNFDWFFKLKNLWIDFVDDGETSCCICLHSWFITLQSHHLVKIKKNYRCISFAELCDNIC